ncbi:type I-C CRISPR-associated protein Cas8c/Csd1 [Methylicorpusculum sp.]|uniref:type I-C CRISPR-associated protein Cas8c/Csd1 n=3 Tax=Methylicorpusculum sp. TaxID=2713644 RepID=UPI002728D99E|nr:type I-C CRISPR-associated protein Cas8c/Csd1 [Methylicorpusculum sp.]MDO8844477.1 type I-C CRISPR-associated protein Cas8c/Csd1 [Methylicorpusculum sp.]MDP2179086.1 type I-C CRISPR-associated protein Cas8c/Csd1 [Methylicorpusculum sp.]MDP3529457.1 type I-C CRISPR-associated protein Cas8c/Csd1 [Methylicorpusculum sp.]
MILSSLAKYYQRLADTPDAITGLARVPSYGFSEERISYILVLKRNGQLVDVHSNLSDDKKPKGRYLTVPWSVKRSGQFTEKAFKEGKNNAFFLWDKTAYFLGVESDGKNGLKISQLTFEAFKKLHLDLLADAEDEGLRAVCLFLRDFWKPEQFASPLFKNEMLDANFVFKLDGDTEYIHERREATNVWLKVIAPKADASKAICLDTGKHEPFMNLHPSIKGVYGGQSSGGSIVSFNADAYTSYGKSQGENAPVSEIAAFAYTTALNYLLRRENNQCMSLGDTSTVFWAVAGDGQTAQQAESLFSFMLNMPADDGQQTAQIKPVLDKIAKGRPLKEFAPNLDPETRFFVLGLAPNAARMSIRYWLDTTFGQLASHISEHFQDLSLNPLPWREPPSVWRLLIQTATQGKSENIPPQLAGEVMRAILTGQSYPRMLLAQLIQRIRSDGDINGIRVAMIKAIIQRDFRKGLIQEEVPMSLNLSSTHTAYRLGRLFAVIERIQEAALGRDLNSTVTDKYYGTASTVPFSVFPRLLAGSQNHLTRLRKDKPGYAVNLKKDLAEIIAGIENSFPRHLSIEEQGRFAIGYYHQKQSYFESNKKADAVADESNESTNNKG